MDARRLVVGQVEPNSHRVGNEEASLRVARCFQVQRRRVLALALLQPPPFVEAREVP